MMHSQIASPCLLDVASAECRPLRLARPGWLSTLRLWQARYSQRRALLRLNERLLSDVGLSRADAEREAAKPFWRE